MEREIRKSRSSILKPNKTRNALNELDLEDTLEMSPRQTRRVSFANLNFIKPFMTDPEKNTIWDSTIEETLSHSDSSSQDDNSVDCSNKYDLNTTKILDEIDMDISQADLYEGKIWTKEIVECTEKINIQNHTTSTKCQILSSTSFKNVQISATRSKQIMDDNDSSYPISNLIENKAVPVVCDEQNTDCEMELTLQNATLDEFGPVALLTSKQNRNENMELTCQNPIMNRNKLNFTIHEKENIHVEHYINDGMEFTCQNPILYKNQFEHVNVKSKMGLICQRLSTDECGPVSSQNIDDSMEFTCHNLILDETERISVFQDEQSKDAEMEITRQNRTLKEFGTARVSKQNRIDDMEFTRQESILNRDNLVSTIYGKENVHSGMRMTHQNPTINNFVTIPVTHNIEELTCRKQLLNNKNETVSKTNRNKNDNNKMGSTHRKPTMSEVQQASLTSPNQNVDDCMEFSCQNPILNQNRLEQDDVKSKMRFTRQNPHLNNFETNSTYQNIEDGTLKKNQTVFVPPQYHHAIANTGLTHQTLSLNDTSLKENIVDGMEFTCQNPILNQNRPVHLNRQNLSRNEFAHVSKTFPEQNINDNMELTCQNPILKKNHPVCVTPQYQHTIAKIGSTHQNLILNDTSQVSPTSPKEIIVDGMEFTCQNPILNQNRAVHVNRQNLSRNEFAHVSKTFPDQNINDSMEFTCQNPILKKNHPVCVTPQYQHTIAKIGSTHQNLILNDTSQVSPTSPKEIIVDGMEFTCQNPILNQNRPVHVNRQNLSRNEFAHVSKTFPDQNINDSMEFTCQNPILKKNHPVCLTPQYQHTIAKIGSTHQNLILNDTSQVSPTSPKEIIVDGMEFTCQNPILNQNRAVHVNRQNLSRNEFAHVSKTFPDQNINDSMEFTCQNPILKKNHPVCLTPQYQHTIDKIGSTHQNLILNDTSQVSPTSPKEIIVDGMEFTCQNPILNQNRAVHVNRQNLSRNEFAHVSKTFPDQNINDSMEFTCQNPILKKNHPVCVTPQYQHTIAKIGSTHQNLILNDTSQVSPTSPKEIIVDGMEFTCQNPILNQNRPVHVNRQKLSRNEFAHVSKTFPEQNINDSMEFTCQNPILKQNQFEPEKGNSKTGSKKILPVSNLKQDNDSLELICQNPALKQNQSVCVANEHQNTITKTLFVHQNLHSNVMAQVSTSPKENIIDGMEFTCQNPVLNQNSPACTKNVICRRDSPLENLTSDEILQVSLNRSRENFIDGMKLTCHNSFPNKNKSVGVSPQNPNVDSLTSFRNNIESIRTVPAKHLTDETMNFTFVPATWKNNILSATINENKDITTVEEKIVDHEMSFDDQSIMVHKMDLVHSAIGTPSTSFHFNTLNMSPCTDDTQQLINATLNATKLHKRSKSISTNYILPEETIEIMSNLGTLEEANPIIVVNKLNEIIDKETSNRETAEEASSKIVQNKLKKNKHKKTLNFETSNEASPRLVVNKLIKINGKETSSGETSRETSPKMARNKFNKINDTYVINKLSSKNEQEREQSDIGWTSSNLLIDDYRVEIPRAETMSDKLKKFVDAIQISEITPLPRPSDSSDLREHYAESKELNKLIEHNLKNILKKIKLFSLTEEDLSLSKDESTEDCEKLESLCSPSNSTIKQKIELASQKCDKSWEIIRIEDGMCSFKTFFELSTFFVEFIHETELVTNITTDSFLQDEKPIYHFLHKEFIRRLGMSNLRSVLGYRFDILSMLDYVQMTMEVMNDYLMEFKQLFRSHGLKMDGDCRAEFKVLNVELILILTITIDMSDMEQVDKDSITIKTDKGKVDEKFLLDLVPSCCKGFGFLKNYIGKVDEYVRLLLKRRRFQTTVKN